MSTSPRRGGALPKILKGASQVGLARLITISSRALYIVIVARSYGAELYGLFSAAQSWTLAFLPLTTLGLGAYIVRTLSQDRSRQHEVLNQSLTLVLVAAAVSGSASLLLGVILESDQTAGRLILLFSFALIARGLIRWMDSAFTAFERLGFTLRLEASFRLLELSGVLLVLASGGGVLLIAAVSAALFWIQALTGFYLVREKLVRGPLRVDFSNLKNLLTLSIPLALSQFFAEATMQYPIVLARHLIEDKGVVGNIALSFQAVLVAAVIPWSLTQASMPAVMRSAARHDGRDGQFAEAMIRMAAIGGAALVVSAAWVGKPLISMLLGAEYSLAGAMLWHALLIVAPLTVAVGTRSWLIARGRYHVVALIGLAGFATLVGCAALIIPAVGPKGVYVAAGFGHLVVAAGGLVLVFREDPAVFGRHTVYSFLLACVAGAVYAVLARVNLAGIGALLAATTLVTGGFLWCLTNQEREWLIQKTAMLTGYSRRD